ncbi:MAG TPA: hypothetical protein VIL20_31315 [Sandaracinaceae bacterium]
MRAWMTVTCAMVLAGASVLGGCDGGGSQPDSGPVGSDGGDSGQGQPDSGPGQPDSGPGPGPVLRDVTLNITDADPHVGQLVELRIVDADDVLVARGIVAALPSGDYSFAFPSSTPEGPHRLDFFADLSMNGAYDPPPADHAWRRDVAASGDVVIDFPHGTDFTDISSPAITEHGDFTFEASEMGPHVGQLFELRVIRESDGRLVGRYVLPEIQAADFSLTIPGIIENGVEYRVDFWADLSDDGQYQAPPVDHAWRETVTGGASGATVHFTHHTDLVDVEF